MFKAIKDNKIVRVAYEWSDQDKRFCPGVKLMIDNEHTPEDYTNIDGEFVLNNDPRAIEYKKEKVRIFRNAYLEHYVDPIASNQLRWNDLSEKEKQNYSDYRRYLLDYTEKENWWEQNPITFEEWENK